jgi:hypothetical protein
VQNTVIAGIGVNYEKRCVGYPDIDNNIIAERDSIRSTESDRLW